MALVAAVRCACHVLATISKVLVDACLVIEGSTPSESLSTDTPFQHFARVANTNVSPRGFQRTCATTTAIPAQDEPRRRLYNTTQSFSHVPVRVIAA